MESINTSDQSYEQDVLKAELPVVVDVWAPWCGPCKMVGPALERIADANEHRFKLVFANMEDFPMTAEEIGVAILSGPMRKPVAMRVMNSGFDLSSVCARVQSPPKWLLQTRMI